LARRDKRRGRWKGLPDDNDMRIFAPAKIARAPAAERRKRVVRVVVGLILTLTAAGAYAAAHAGLASDVAAQALAPQMQFHAELASAGGTSTGVISPNAAGHSVALRRVTDSNPAALLFAAPAKARQPATPWTVAAWETAGVASVLMLAVAGLLLGLRAQANRRSTALVRENAGLLQRLTQLDATLDGMGDGIMMVDAELRLVEWNISFPELTGVPRKALRIGVDMEEILRAQALAGEFGDVDVDAEVTRRIASLRTGSNAGMTQRRRPNGRVLELRRNPLPGGGFVTLYTDITERLAMEQRLQQSEKMAAVGRLTAGVAHDFNNLLATIVGSAELLERQASTNPALARRLELIMQAAARGSDLVRQLLAFAKQQPLELMPVDLNHILEGMAALLRATMGSKIRIENKMAVGLWPAIVDPVQIEHVILNLAINARDAMTDGGLLTIATANVILAEPRHGVDVPAGEYVTVALSDTGTGMTEDVLRKSFEPFFTTKGPGRGSGLGLSQVYGVASQSGGCVEVVSQYGQGTTVRVFLPRGEAEVSATPACLDRPAEAQRAEHRRSGARAEVAD
jgi:signal transduction histidine kinase